MGMKTGLDDGKYYEKIYEDDTKYFNISMTNSAFTYDPATNIIRVNPGDEPEQDGEMIITWKNQEGTFNTKPCARKIKLHWDRLRDGYYIASRVMADLSSMQLPENITQRSRGRKIR